MPAHRRLKTTARWACTIMAALILGAWVASVWFEVFCNTAGRDRFTQLVCGSGQLTMYRMLNRRPTSADWSIQNNAVFDTYGMQWGFELSEISTGGWELRIPLWAPFLTFALPAAFLWRSHIRNRRRIRAGACPNCGYDRRGLTNTTPCPECATAGPA